MAAAVSNKRSLFSGTQTAQLKQKIEHELEQSTTMYNQGRYPEALIAALDYIDCAQSLPVSAARLPFHSSYIIHLTLM